MLQDKSVSEDPVLFNFQVLLKHVDHFRPFLQNVFVVVISVVERLERLQRLEHGYDAIEFSFAFFERGLDMIDLMLGWFKDATRPMLLNSAGTSEEDSEGDDENEGTNGMNLVAPSIVEEVCIEAEEADALGPPRKRQRLGESAKTPVKVMPPPDIGKIVTSNTLHLYIKILVQVAILGVENDEDDITGRCTRLLKRACKLYKNLVHASLATPDDKVEMIIEELSSRGAFDS